MTLPKMKPTPMPGPMVPRPAPMPRPIALPALRPYSWGSAAWAICVMTDRSTAIAPLVLGGHGAAEVDRGQGGEDEGLQRGDQADLEEEEGDGHDAGHEAEDDGQADGHVQQHHEAAAHEQDEQVARKDVGEETDAQADEAHQVRDDLDDEDRAARRALDAGRDPAREVLDEALGPDALDVVADPDDERQHERHRQVRGRREQRQRRDLDAEDVNRVLGVRRQRQVADDVREPDEQEDGPDEREPLRGHRVVHVPARDVVAHEQERRLDRGLQPVRPRLHAPRDVDHREAGQRGRDEDVEDRLVELDRADREPRLELELVLRPVGLVDRGERRGGAGEQHGDRQEGGERAADHEGCLSFCMSNGRMIMDTVKYAVNSTMTRTAAARPASSSFRPAAKIVSATNHPRPIMEPAAIPTTVRGSSAAAARRVSATWTARWTSHAPAPAA